MRFFFDCQNDLFEVHDKDGVELPSVEEARAHAMRALGGILTDLAGQESKGRLLVTVRVGKNPRTIIRGLAFFDVSEPM